MYTTELGSNRIVYKATDFHSGVAVTAYVWSPSLVKSSEQTFTEIEEGLYYLDFNFAAIGVWPMLLYEDGSKVGFAVMRVGISGCEPPPPSPIRATVLLA